MMILFPSFLFCFSHRLPVVDYVKRQTLKIFGCRANYSAYQNNRKNKKKKKTKNFLSCTEVPPSSDMAKWIETKDTPYITLSAPPLPLFCRLDRETIIDTPRHSMPQKSSYARKSFLKHVFLLFLMNTHGLAVRTIRLPVYTLNPPPSYVSVFACMRTRP